MADLNNKTVEQLYFNAKEAGANAYAPYSGFCVGASVLTSNGEIFTGSNVENASYGLTVCAERNAIFHAVNSGKREIDALALVADCDPDKLVPCGACLQVMSEFMDDEAMLYCGNLESVGKSHRLKDLLPKAFRLEMGGKDDC